MQIICNFIQKQICISCAEICTKKIALNMHKILNKYALNFPIHRLQHAGYAEYMQKKKMHKNAQKRQRICREYAEHA